jgi:predicted RecA/RadA family phage recombinase
MATNEVFKRGDWLDLPVASGVVAGAPVVVGELVGVAQTTRDADGTASVALAGVFNLSVTGITAVGTAIYITGAGALVITSTGNRLFGHALAVKTAGAAVIPVRLVGNANGPAA